MPRIKITIPRKGLSEKKSQVQVDAEGFNGVGCKAVTEAFQKSIGTIVNVVDKPELFVDDQEQFVQQDA